MKAQGDAGQQRQKQHERSKPAVAQSGRPDIKSTGGRQGGAGEHIQHRRDQHQNGGPEIGQDDAGARHADGNPRQGDDPRSD